MSKFSGLEVFPLEKNYLKGPSESPGWIYRWVTISHSGSEASCTLPTRARISKRLWSPGIDSEGSIPSAYVAWRAGTTNRVVLPARQSGNQFLGSLKGLQIRAQGTCIFEHNVLNVLNPNNAFILANFSAKAYNIINTYSFPKYAI
jgi:hypothetical protein